MKTLYQWLCLVAFACIALSCTESEVSDNHSVKEYLTRRSLITKSALETLSSGISENDVVDYLKIRMSINPDEIKDITRYDITEDSYVFIVNLLRGGWYIFSGDYSSSPVLVEGEKGDFYVDDQLSKHDRLMLESIVSLIRKNRESNSDYAITNQRIWANVILSARNMTPGLNMLNLGDPDTMDVSIDVYLDTIWNDDFPFLTQTNWWPSTPFNNATPFVEKGGDRCFVGCAVIAIAQLLYYTHYAFGYPNFIYSKAECTDLYSAKTYNYVFSGYTNTSWDKMSKSYADAYQNHADSPYEAALCAMISNRSNTRYDPEGGSTSRDDIAGTLEYFTLTGTKMNDFVHETIFNEIKQKRPVLCSGESSTTGHAYIIDGFKRLYVLSVEEIRDMNGNVIARTTDVWANDLKWYINTGEPRRILIEDNAYYPKNRKIYTGWGR